MYDLLSKLRPLLTPNPGWYVLGAAVALALVGIFTIDTVEPGLASRQFRFWLPVAVVAAGASMVPRPRSLGLATWPLLAASMALLVFVLLPFVPQAIVPRVNGATAWIDLGPMRFQPSEMAKVAFVLWMAWHLRFRESHRTFLGLLLPFVIMCLPLALILLEPDLGQAMVFGPTLAIMLVAAGAKLRHLSVLLGIALVVVTLNVAVVAYQDTLPQWIQPLKPHQRARISALISQVQGDDRYAQDIGYQAKEAQTLIGAGGVGGYGEERSRTILTFNHLPESHNDMVFAVVVNRWGLLGGGLTISLYGILTGSMLWVAGRARDPFAQLTCVGFAGMIFTQATINIGMTLGLLPITGITLPLVSYGGSSLVFTFVMVGLVLNFAARRPALINRPSFEFDRRPNRAAVAR